MKKLVVITLIMTALTLLVLAPRGTKVVQGPRPNVPCKACVVQGPKPNEPCRACVADRGHHPGGPYDQLNYGFQRN